ncbi:hypothetical protein HZH66_011336 [Vespula vulgaris]|uniref:Uncharacterized protein n=1 Tax=Vespula vulgaris TaxID=7454 RepID=A0A834MX41_VESVU|nr:hypothetical protein HZH66_011336 [Vespula vulgaris]
MSKDVDADAARRVGDAAAAAAAAAGGGGDADGGSGGGVSGAAAVADGGGGTGSGGTGSGGTGGGGELLMHPLQRNRFTHTMHTHRDIPTYFPDASLFVDMPRIISRESVKSFYPNAMPLLASNRPLSNADAL